LSIYLWILSYSRTSTKITIPSFFADVLGHVENNYHMYENNPQIVIYFNLIMLVSGRNEKYFVLLKNLKSKYYDVLSTLDRNNLFTMMTNFCHDMILGGNFNYRTERFRLDNEYLRKELYNILGEFHISYFMAIAKNAVKLKKFKWAEDFKNKYSVKLNSENREFAMSYIQAEIYFTKGDFGKAIERLSRLKLKQSNHKQYTRNLMIQVYYETHDEEALRSLLDTGRHFLHHDRYLSETAKENSSNFMRFTEKLVNLKLHGKVTEIEILKKNIIKSSNVQNKDWLLEKIDEIEHK
jgi:outer membrane PBP1 activator LpoA protein